jgi:hypothetical protein
MAGMLPQAIKGSSGPDSGIRIGVVSSTSPFMVTVQGVELALTRLASYTPSVGDNVAILVSDSTWLVLGSEV